MKKFLSLLLVLAFCLSMVGFRNAPVSDAAGLLEGKQVGDVVSYGSYPMTASGELGEIEWIIISKTDSTATLMSRYALDVKRYHTDNYDTSWEACNLNGWLQLSFKNEAFTGEEYLYLRNVRLLTASEAKSMPKSWLQCEPTPYAAEVKNGQVYNVKRDGQWWLQDYIGGTSVNDCAATCAAYVTGDGTVVDSRIDAKTWTICTGVAVRPVVDVMLEADYPVPLAEAAAMDTQGRLERGGLCVTSAAQLFFTDVVTYGRYPMTASGEMGEIEWLVIRTTEDTVTLMSRYALDIKKYHDHSGATSWETCSLNEWLQSSFMQTAFSPEEQANLECVRLLTVAESEPMQRWLLRCSLTPYATLVKKDVHPVGRLNWWWMQDYLGKYVSKEGKASYGAVYVTEDGIAGKTKGGAWTTFSGIAVRPVIEVRINEP